MVKSITLKGMAVLPSSMMSRLRGFHRRLRKYWRTILIIRLQLQQEILLSRRKLKCLRISIKEWSRRVWPKTKTKLRRSCNFRHSSTPMITWNCRKNSKQNLKRCQTSWTKMEMIHQYQRIHLKTSRRSISKKVQISTLRITSLRQQVFLFQNKSR